ncbi:acyl carrier protein [Sphingomonas panacisoli]|uniref:Acyl carrier protein n=1 Tax=Sphingomonas panacisoli TaxID=1813879 RepID=A0A5B8LIS0_9SPHN|nr:acyl carrier protein [Sphingomonas panacisoli]QDZ08073.1 acyl carrier protein [Sphingomonas panacisoli]
MEQSRAAILETIQGIVESVLGVPGVAMTEDTTAQDVDGWDSLTHVQIIVAIEQHYNIRFSFSEVAQLENAGSLIDAVLRHTGG